MKEIGVWKYKAIIDDSDFKLVSKYRWGFISKKKRKHMYPVTFISNNGKAGILSMHRLIVGEVPDGLVVDHVNGNSLDNRRSNLEIVTHGENIRRGFALRPETFKEKKIKLFAKLWGMWKKPEVIVILMDRQGFGVSLSWVKAKIARVRHF